MFFNTGLTHDDHQPRPCAKNNIPQDYKQAPLPSILATPSSNAITSVQMAQDGAGPAGELDLSLWPLLITRLPPWSSFPNLAKTPSGNLPPGLHSFSALGGGNHCYSGSTSEVRASPHAPNDPGHREHRACLPHHPSWELPSNALTMAGKSE